MANNLFLRNALEGDDKNLCFTNAALQILRNIPEFKEKLKANVGFHPIHQKIIQVLSKEGTDVTVSAHSIRQTVGQAKNKKELYIPRRYYTTCLMINM